MRWSGSGCERLGDCGVAVVQIGGTVFTAVAAVAAAVSARATLRTAGRADETSRRAAEALSRATRPDFGGLLSHSDERSSAPQPMRLFVHNRTPHRGWLLGARVETADGTLLAEVTGLSVEIGGDVMGSSDSTAYLPLGVVPRAQPNVRSDDSEPPGGVPIIWFVEFTDAARLARWRQRGCSNETVRFDEGDETPIYLYADLGAAEPELVPEAGMPALPARHRRRRRSA